MTLLYLLIASLALNFALEIDLDKREELCLIFRVHEPEVSLKFDALAIGKNHKLIEFKLMRENGDILQEQKNKEEFHYKVIQATFNEHFKFCFKNTDDSKKSVMVNFNERVLKSPVANENYDALRAKLKDLLGNLRKIDQGILFKEKLAVDHIGKTENNLSSMKFGSIVKLLVLALITGLQIFVLVKFIKRKENAFK